LISPLIRAVLNEWETARSTFMESLGHRAHKWTPGFAPQSSSAHHPEDPQQPLLDYAHPSQKSFESSFIGSPYFNKLSATPAKKTGSLAAETLDALPTASSSGSSGSDKPVLPKMVSSSADCIRKISQNQSNYLSSRVESIHPCKLLLSSLKDFNNNNSNNSSSAVLSMKDMIGYRSILSLIASMTGEDRYGNDATPGFFSAICYDPALMDILPLKEKKNRLTKGAKLFFEEQQMSFWEKKVDDLVARNEMDLMNRSQGRTMQMKLQKLLQYEYRMNIIPKQCKMMDISLVSNAQAPITPALNASLSSLSGAAGGNPNLLKNVPIWALIYSYLRSGNITFAIQELHDLYLLTHSEEMFSVLCILKVINGESNDTRELKSPRAGSAGPGGFFGSSNNLQTPKSSNAFNANFSGNASNLDLENLENALKQCKFYYQRETMKDENSSDPYFIFLLNLIGFIDHRDLNGSLIPNFSFEDFLWSHLWFIIHSRQLNELLLGKDNQNQSNLNASHLGTPSMMLAHSPFHRKPVSLPIEFLSEENELLELVYAYGGANYFDSDGNSPFKYALLLCCCHRFGDAIHYLWMMNKTFPAIHLMIVFQYYGLILPHVPLLNNPIHPLVMSDYHHYHHQNSNTALKGGAGGGNDKILSLTPSNLISYFLSNSLFQDYYLEYCLDYLFSLNSKWFETLSFPNEENLKIQIIKFDEMMMNNLVSFIISLSSSSSSPSSLDALMILFGKPLFYDSNPSLRLDAFTKKEYRTKGYLDSYLKNDKLNLLIMKLVYHYLNVEKDVNKIIDFYYLILGNFNEIISLFNQELMKYWILENTVSVEDDKGIQHIYAMNLEDLEQQKLFLSSSSAIVSTGGGGGNNHLLLQRRKQRDYWRTKSMNFMKIILETSKTMENKSGGHFSSALTMEGAANNNNILLLLNISSEIYNNFYLLLTLYQFHDELYQQQNYSQALTILEKGRIFPGLSTETMDGMVFFLNGVLKNLLDNLILLIFKCFYGFMKDYEETMKMNNNRMQRDAMEKEYSQMIQRFHSLNAFIAKFKEQFHLKNIILQEFQKLQSFLTVH
jgi:hypothetical protein